MKNILEKYTDEEIENKINNFIENSEYIIINEEIDAVSILFEEFVILTEKFTNKDSILYCYIKRIKPNDLEIIDIDDISEEFFKNIGFYELYNKILEYNKKIENYQNKGYEAELELKFIEEYGEENYLEEYEEELDNFYEQFEELILYSEIKGQMHKTILNAEILEEKEELELNLNEIKLKNYDILSKIIKDKREKDMEVVQKEFDELENTIKTDINFIKCTNQKLRLDYQTKYFNKLFKEICPVAYSIYHKTYFNSLSANKKTDVSIFIYNKINRPSTYLEILYKDIKDKK